MSRLWRAAFHAAIHLEIERRFAVGALTTARVRERIHRIGETEFDEVRLVLRHEESLLPPYDDRATFTEFAAIYLELRSFEPRLLDRLFPTLRDLARVDGAIDIDPAPLLREDAAAGAAGDPRGRPIEPAVVAGRGAAARRAQASARPSLAAMDGLFAQAAVARRRGNDVRAALLGLAALEVAPPERAGAALAAARADLDSLAARLDRALRLEREPTAAERTAVLAV